MLIDFAAHMLSAQCLIHTQIIDVECLDRCQHIVICMMLKHTKCISHHMIFLVHANKDRTLIISDNIQKLLVIIFFHICLKQIRSAVMVHHQHLIQQLVNTI